MPKGYWIAHVDVTDADRYPEYVRLDTPVVERFGGRFVVRGGDHIAPEGPVRSRHVVVEFDDYKTALDCYRSADYQAAAKIRREASQSDIVITEGLPDVAAPVGGGFWIVQFDAKDGDALGAYAEKAAAYLAANGGTYLAKLGAHEAPETPQRGVHVIVAFKDYATAKAVYEHPDYAPLIRMRLDATEGETVVIAGAA